MPATVIRLTILLMISALTACGPRVEKAKKVVDPNNTTANNTTANNTTANNTTANNTTANNTTVNNTTVNNTQACVGVSPAALNFGEVVVGLNAQATVTLENCSATQTLSINGATAPQDFDTLLPEVLDLAPQTTALVTVQFAPSMPGAAVGQVTIETNAGSAVVNVQGTGTEATEGCPIAVPQGRASAGEPWSANVTASVGSTIELTGTNSSAQSTITSYTWSIISRPGGSTARLTPNAMVASPMLNLDLAGVYTVELSVATDRSPPNCPAARMNITTSGSTDPELISIQLVWDTPADPNQSDTIGSDLDLHYMHPMGTWNTPIYDCFWQNKMANWGADGTASVDIDDLDGMGPENISHAFAGPKVYRIGVHYYTDGQFGASTATVTVRRGGTQLYQAAKQLTVDQFWFVGGLDAATDTFTPNGTITTGFPP